MHTGHNILGKVFNPLLILILIGTLISCQYPPPPATPTPTTVSPPTVAVFEPSGTININGQQRFLFGANYPWYNYGTDFGESAWGYSGVSVKRSEIDSDFQLMSQMGIKVVRWFVFTDGRSAPEFATDGSVAGLDDKIFGDLDVALEIAQRYNIHLVFVLLDFKWLRQQEEDNGVMKGGHSDVIQIPEKRATFFQNALIPLLQRYGDNPYILSWEVINEPEWAVDDSTIETQEPMVRVPLESMQNFVSEAAQVIHSNTSKQLVTVGSASRRWWNFWEGKGLDLCQIHHYDWMEDNENSRLDFPYTSMGTNLPCIVGEFPSAGSTRSAEDYYRIIIDNGFMGAFPWSLRGTDPHSDLLSQTSTIQIWSERLVNYLEIPFPDGWVPPTALPTYTPEPTPLPTITVDPNLKDDSKYGFEVRQEDWAKQTYAKSLAVTDIHYVYPPDHPVFSGQYSLQLDVNLVPSKEPENPLNNGEVYVDIGKHPPSDNLPGLPNLENGIITCWVYLPKEAYAVNDNPWIAFQVFAKDDYVDPKDGQRSEYGAWTRVNADEVGEWIQISLSPRTFQPTGGWIDPRGFNPQVITLIGVKVGIDDFYAKQDVSYNGPVYIDACTWKE